MVDATFEHRVSDAEREEVRQAMLNGEIISPPAGAIGRGDAFVLRIAERTGAIVLSNDSFQEFHGEHPWLFDEGRLIGGKPVPGVGWIFTPRLPIRGPKSRAATAEAKAKKDPDSAPAKAAELAKAAKKAAKRTSKARKSAPRRTSPPVDTSWPITPTVPPPGRAKVDPVLSNAIDEAVEEALHPPRSREVPGLGQEGRRGQEAGAGEAGEGQEGRSTQGSKRRRAGARRRRRAGGPESRHAAARRQRAADFINFVATFAVGSTIEGEVVSFTSHGAMVDVAMPGGGAMHCYIPLTAMGTPPPTKARQVLKKGEVRAFVLAGLDPPRRVAELALPMPGGPGGRESRVAADEAAAARPKRGPAEEGGPAKAAKKAAAKKAAAPRRRQPRRRRLRQEGSRKKAPAEEGRQGQEGAGQEGRRQEGARPRRRRPRRPARRRATESEDADGVAPARRRPAASAALPLRDRADRGRTRRLGPGAMGAHR